MYTITAKFISSISAHQLALLLQDVYDSSCVAGQFLFSELGQDEREVTFSRYVSDDRNYILEAIPEGVAITTETITAAAIKQLIAELTDVDEAEELTPMIHALTSESVVCTGMDKILQK